MSDFCQLCHDPIDLVEWTHPATGEPVTLCRFCARSVIAVCHECGEILVSVDRYGVDEKGNKICSSCASGHEMRDEDKARKQ